MKNSMHTQRGRHRVVAMLACAVLMLFGTAHGQGLVVQTVLDSTRAAHVADSAKTVKAGLCVLRADTLTYALTKTQAANTYVVNNGASVSWLASWSSANGITASPGVYEVYNNGSEPDIYACYVTANIVDPNSQQPKIFEVADFYNPLTRQDKVSATAGDLNDVVNGSAWRIDDSIETFFFGIPGSVFFRSSPTMFDLPSGLPYAIGGSVVLSSSSLGTGITSAPSLAAVSTLTSGATGAGFTLNFAASTLSGSIPTANGGLGANVSNTSGMPYDSSGTFLVGSRWLKPTPNTGTLVVAGASTVYTSETAGLGTNSTSAYKMAGVDTNCSPSACITLSKYGAVTVTIDGSMSNTTSGDSVLIKLVYGASSGAIPKNGDAATGTVVGSGKVYQALTGQLVDGVPFSFNAYISGLSAGTRYWFDLQIEAGTGGNAFVRNCNVKIHEEQY